MADQVQLDDIVDLIDNMLPVTAEEPMSSTSILKNLLTKPTMGPGYNPTDVQGPGSNPIAVQGPGYNPMAVQGLGCNSMAMAAIPACSVCRAPGEGSCVSYGKCHR